MSEAAEAATNTTIDEAVQVERSPFDAPVGTEELQQWSMIAKETLKLQSDLQPKLAEYGNALFEQLDSIIELEEHAKVKIPGNPNPGDIAMQIIAKMARIARQIKTGTAPQFVGNAISITNMVASCVEITGSAASRTSVAMNIATQTAEKLGDAHMDLAARMNRLEQSLALEPMGDEERRQRRREENMRILKLNGHDKPAEPSSAPGNTETSETPEAPSSDESTHENAGRPTTEAGDSPPDGSSSAPIADASSDSESTENQDKSQS